MSPEEVLATDVAAGDDQVLKISAVTVSPAGANGQSADRLEPDHIPESRWQVAMARYRAIAPLVGLTPRTTASVKAVADELMVSAATIYRWLDGIEREGSVSCMGS